MMAPTYVGCAGWSLPRTMQGEFPAEGTHLVRYAARFNAVEINSTFYRPHRGGTYARWADAVPDDFAFSVKMPRRITHDRRLIHVADALEEFAGEVSGLGTKLRCVLIQLPPSLQFDRALAEQFLGDVQQCFAAPAVVEARHATWFGDEASAVLTARGVGRVRADPPAVAWPTFPTAPIRYHRMHGSPRMYYSKYEPAALEELADELTTAAMEGIPGWCIFDNTTLGHATDNALVLQGLMVRRKDGE